MNVQRSPFVRRRALVLGASGFIGYWVARALSAQGAHVTCAVRSHEAAERLARERLGTVVIRRDLADVDGIAEWLPALRPAIVFNLAGYGVDRGERDEAMADCINRGVVGAVARAMASLPPDDWSGVRLVHVGSALEYGSAGGVLTEESPCLPTTTYGRTKLAGTRALQDVVRETGVDACVARLFTVYGPGEHAGRLLPTLMEAARTGGRVPLSEGLQRRDFSYVEDVAEGLLRLSVSDVTSGEVVHVASGTMQSVRAFAETAAFVLRLPRGSLDFGALPGHPEEMVHEGVSVTRMRAYTRWAPTDDLAEGIARTIVRDVQRTRDRVEREGRAIGR